MESKPKRRWPKFSIRSLLVLVVALAVPLGWVVHERRQYWIEQRIATKLRSLGVENIGFVQPNKLRTGSFIGNSQGWLGDFDLATWLKGERISSITAYTAVDEIDLTMLEQLTHLYALNVRSNRAFDFSRIARLQHLRRFSIIGPCGDLKPLAELPHLNLLFVDCTASIDLTPLANLAELNRLHISCTEEIDLEPLTNLPELRWLSLDSVPISDLSPIAKLHSLEYLEVRNTHLADLSPLASMLNLSGLNLKGTRHTKEQVESLIKSRRGSLGIEWGRVDE